MGCVHGRRARGRAARRRRRAGVAHRRDPRCADRRVGLDLRQIDVRGHVLHRPAAERRRRCPPCVRRDDADVAAGPALDDGTPAARRYRGDRAVQCAVPAGDEEGRAGAGRRQYFHPQAVGGNAHYGAQDRRDIRGGQAAARRAQCDSRPGVRGRRQAGDRSARAHDHLHRLDQDRPLSGGRGGQEPQEVHPRAGRQEPADRAQGRRYRLRGQRRGLRHLFPPGPGLHGQLEADRRRRDL